MAQPQHRTDGAPGLLVVEDLTRRFGNFRAVNGASLQVPAGGIIGLIGPNGAGKTTLFNMIAGALPPTSGRILFDGQELTGTPPWQMVARGLVRTFQIPHEFSTLTVLENLMVVPAGQSGARLWQAWLRWGRVMAEERALRDRAEEALEFLNLSHLRDERAGNLSGGQKKLLELGRAMMSSARFVLLDEPAAGVNRTLLAQLSDRIARLRAEGGYTFLIIEHDMNMVTQLCDEVIVMAHGEILMRGSMAEVRANRAVQEAYLGVRASREGQPAGASA